MLTTDKCVVFMNHFEPELLCFECFYKVLMSHVEFSIFRPVKWEYFPGPSLLYESSAVQYGLEIIMPHSYAIL